MAATPDSWTGPGSGGSASVAPNTFWWQANAAGQTSSIAIHFFNSGGGLVTVDASFALWDITAGASVFVNTATGVNNMSIGPFGLTNGHTYTYALSYNNGTSCDHCICSSTSQSASTSDHSIFSVWRSGAWVGVPGPSLRVWRSGAWVPINGGVSVWRSGAWAPL